LQGENLGRFASVLPAPDVAVVAGVDQFYGEIEVVTLLDELSGEDAFYAELLADDFRIDVFSSCTA